MRPERQISNGLTGNQNYASIGAEVGTTASAFVYLGMKSAKYPDGGGSHFMPADRTADLFLQFSRNKLLEQYWPRLRKTVEPLTLEQVWWRPNEASNSIGNLLLHLNGNVRQWLVASFNQLEDHRDRPKEFSATGDLPTADLVARLNETVEEAAKVLARLTSNELVATYQIQGYTVSGLAAVYQVVEHFGLHYGQIVYIAKALEGRDLGFYSALSKTGRATGGSV